VNVKNNNLKEFFCLSTVNQGLHPGLRDLVYMGYCCVCDADAMFLMGVQGLDV
jgi:hypothetical protein